MRSLFFKISFAVISFQAVLGFFYPSTLFALVLTGPIVLVGMHNAFQKKRAILRNFPILGMIRYAFEGVRPEIQQYFVEDDVNGTPISRELRSVVYQRAKKQIDTLPFGTQKNVYAEGYEWIGHSLTPKHVNPESLRVKIGGPDCKKPYSASVLNISAMSYGALSKNAVQSLNGGAKIGGFYHNTGEGGVSPYHLQEGGDLVWQIGTGYFGCRNDQGGFSAELFQKMVEKENIKMIEIKISQGAKPSHGGILPKAKITPEIMEIRKVPAGRDVVSPPAHSEFSNPITLLKFVKKLRELSGGKPVGFKLCLGQPHEFMAICKAMVESQILPDFITVDGGEGGTGAAPLEFSNSVGMPLEEGLSFVHDCLVGFGIRKHIKVIASGKVINGFNVFTKMALGADICNSARAMMLALGCIQARKCNTNHCPTGVATSDAQLMVGLDPTDKKHRVASFHKQTVHAFAELLGACGFDNAHMVSRSSVFRRVSLEKVKSYEELFPGVLEGSFVQGILPSKYQQAFARASSQSFAPADSPSVHSKAS